MNSYRQGALNNKILNYKEEDEVKNNDIKNNNVVPIIINTYASDLVGNDDKNSNYLSMNSKSSFLSPTSSSGSYYNRKTHNDDNTCSILHQSSENLNNSDNLEVSCLSPLYTSSTCLAYYEDPWKTSSIGIKCTSYKPIGCVFLTRRILDLYVTDGKRKVDILYSYSKLDRDKAKVPSIGSSIENCSFCDTITLDLDPESALFDLVMDVHIITQGAKTERNKAIDQFDLNTQTASNLDNSDEEETISFTSSYDIKYLRPEHLMNKRNASEPKQIEYNAGSSTIEKDNERDKTNEEIDENIRKIIIKTIIKSDLSESFDYQRDKLSPTRDLNYSMNSDRSNYDRNYKSMRSSSANIFSDSLSYNRYKRNAITPDKLSIRRSKRSIITTVEFHPQIEATIEEFNLENEDQEREIFFKEFQEKCQMLEKLEQEMLESQSNNNKDKSLDNDLSVNHLAINNNNFSENISKSSLYESSIDSVINDSEDNFNELGEENRITELVEYLNENETNKNAVVENNQLIKIESKINEEDKYIKTVNNDSLFTSINSNEDILWDSESNSKTLEDEKQNKNTSYKSKTDLILDEINEICKTMITNKKQEEENFTVTVDYEYSKDEKENLITSSDIDSSEVHREEIISNEMSSSSTLVFEELLKNENSLFDSFKKDTFISELNKNDDKNNENTKDILCQTNKEIKEKDEYINIISNINKQENNQLNDSIQENKDEQEMLQSNYAEINYKNEKINENFNNNNNNSINNNDYNSSKILLEKNNELNLNESEPENIIKNNNSTYFNNNELHDTDKIVDETEIEKNDENKHLISVIENDGTFYSKIENGLNQENNISLLQEQSNEKDLEASIETTNNLFISKLEQTKQHSIAADSLNSKIEINDLTIDDSENRLETILEESTQRDLTKSESINNLSIDKTQDDLSDNEDIEENFLELEKNINQINVQGELIQKFDLKSNKTFQSNTSKLFNNLEDNLNEEINSIINCIPDFAQEKSQTDFKENDSQPIKGSIDNYDIENEIRQKLENISSEKSFVEFELEALNVENKIMKEPEDRPDKTSNLEQSSEKEPINEQIYSKDELNLEFNASDSLKFENENDQFIENINLNLKREESYIDDLEKKKKFSNIITAKEVVSTKANEFEAKKNDESSIQSNIQDHNIKKIETSNNISLEYENDNEVKVTLNKNSNEHVDTELNKDTSELDDKVFSPNILFHYDNEIEIKDFKFDDIHKENLISSSEFTIQNEHSEQYPSIYSDQNVEYIEEKITKEKSTSDDSEKIENDATNLNQTLITHEESKINLNELENVTVSTNELEKIEFLTEHLEKESIESNIHESVCLENKIYHLPKNEINFEGDVDSKPMDNKENFSLENKICTVETSEAIKFDNHLKVFSNNTQDREEMNESIENEIESFQCILDTNELFCLEKDKVDEIPSPFLNEDAGEIKKENLNEEQNIRSDNIQKFEKKEDLGIETISFQKSKELFDSNANNYPIIESNNQITSQIIEKSKINLDNEIPLKVESSDIHDDLITENNEISENVTENFESLKENILSMNDETKAQNDQFETENTPGIPFEKKGNQPDLDTIEHNIDENIDNKDNLFSETEMNKSNNNISEYDNILVSEDTSLNEEIISSVKEMLSSSSETFSENHEIQHEKVTELSDSNEEKTDESLIIDEKDSNNLKNENFDLSSSSKSEVGSGDEISYEEKSIDSKIESLFAAKVNEKIVENLCKDDHKDEEPTKETKISNISNILFENEEKIDREIDEDNLIRQQNESSGFLDEVKFHQNENNSNVNNTNLNNNELNDKNVNESYFNEHKETEHQIKHNESLNLPKNSDSFTVIPDQNTDSSSYIKQDLNRLLEPITTSESLVDASKDNSQKYYYNSDSKNLLMQYKDMNQRKSKELFLDSDQDEEACDSGKVEKKTEFWAPTNSGDDFDEELDFNKESINDDISDIAEKLNNQDELNFLNEEKDSSFEVIRTFCDQTSSVNKTDEKLLEDIETNQNVKDNSCLEKEEQIHDEYKISENDLDQEKVIKASRESLNDLKQKLDLEHEDLNKKIDVDKIEETNSPQENLESDKNIIYETEETSILKDEISDQNHYDQANFLEIMKSDKDQDSKESTFEYDSQDLSSSNLLNQLKKTESLQENERSSSVEINKEIYYDENIFQTVKSENIKLNNSYGNQSNIILTHEKNCIDSEKDLVDETLKEDSNESSSKQNKHYSKGEENIIDNYEINLPLNVIRQKNKENSSPKILKIGEGFDSFENDNLNVDDEISSKKQIFNINTNSELDQSISTQNYQDESLCVQDNSSSQLNEDELTNFENSANENQNVSSESVENETNLSNYRMKMIPSERDLYFDYLETNNDEIIFPIYKLKKQFVKYEPIQENSTTEDNLSNLTQANEVFDCNSNWDDTYTEKYQQTFVENLETFDPANCDFAVNNKEQENLDLNDGELNLTGGPNIFSSLAFNKIKDFAKSLAQKNSSNESRDNNTEYLCNNLNKDKNDSYFDSLEINRDEIDFEIYNLNKSLPYNESKESIEFEASFKKPSILNDNALFDSFSEWDNNYASNYDTKTLENTETFDANNCDFTIKEHTDLYENISKEVENSNESSQSKFELQNLLNLLPKFPYHENSVKEESIIDEFDFTKNIVYYEQKNQIEEQFHSDETGDSFLDLKDKELNNDMAIFDQNSEFNYNSHLDKNQVQEDRFNILEVFDENNCDFSSNYNQNQQETHTEEIVSDSFLIPNLMNFFYRFPRLSRIEESSNETSEEFDFTKSITSNNENLDNLEVNNDRKLEENQIESNKDMAIFDNNSVWNFGGEPFKTNIIEEDVEVFDVNNCDFKINNLTEINDESQLSENQLHYDEVSTLLPSILNLVSRIPRLPRIEKFNNDSSILDDLDFEKSIIYNSEKRDLTEEPEKDFKDESMIESEKDLSVFDNNSNWNEEFKISNVESKSTNIVEEFDPNNSDFSIQSINQINEIEEKNISEQQNSSLPTTIFNLISKLPRVSRRKSYSSEVSDEFDFTKNIIYNGEIEENHSENLKEELLQTELKLSSDVAIFDDKIEMFEKNDYDYEQGDQNKDNYVEAFDSKNFDFKIDDSARVESEDIFETKAFKSEKMEPIRLPRLFSLFSANKLESLSKDELKHDQKTGLKGIEDAYFDHLEQNQDEIDFIIYRYDENHITQNINNDFSDNLDQDVYTNNKIRDNAIFDAINNWDDNYTSKYGEQSNSYLEVFDSNNCEFSNDEKLPEIENENTSVKNEPTILQLVNNRLARINDLFPRLPQISQTESIGFEIKEDDLTETVNGKSMKEETNSVVIVNTEKLNSKTFDHDAIFDVYSEWDKNYTTNYNKITSDNPETFDPENSDFTIQPFLKENEKSQLEPSSNRSVSTLLRGMFASLPHIFNLRKSNYQSNSIEENNSGETELTKYSIESDSSFIIDPAIFHDDKQQYLSMQTDLIKLDRLNKYLHQFNINDFSEINEFFQDIFIRAPFQYDNLLGFTHNTTDESMPASPSEETFFNYFDIIRFQNLTKNKPYFDDFATFPNQYLEYSSYYLQTNSKKYNFLNSFQRSGTPFFFINDRHRLMSFSDRKSFMSDIFGYFLVSIGAVSLFAYTFK